MRGDFLLNRFHFIPVGEAYVDVDIFKPKSWVHIRGYFVISFDYVFEVDIDEVVEGVDMLLNETLHFQEGG
jgi:hypothetical protein